MSKADDKVSYDGGDKENFTNFELLEKKVELLQGIIDKHADILRDNKLVLTTTTVAPVFDSADLYDMSGNLRDD